MLRLIAVLAPIAAMIATGFVSARGSRVPIVPAAVVTFVGLLALLVVIARRHRRTGILVGAELAGLVLFVAQYKAAPLAAPTPYAGSLPPASPPATMALYQLPTGAIHRTASFGYRGGGFGDRRDFTMTAALVVHPRGDLLIDTGFGCALDEQLRAMPLGFRAITDAERTRSAAEQLDAVGYDRKRLRGVLLTHAHWDHVSGLSELAGAPVLMTPDERRFVDGGGWITAVARQVGGRVEEYTFEGGPYLGFARSHDVYGDGSVVVVPAPGHTPGSVIAFVALPTGRRYAFVGDLVWQLEGITEREERPWPARTLGDVDATAVRSAISTMAALRARFPSEIAIVPAHDGRAFSGLPMVDRASLVGGTGDAAPPLKR